MYVALVGPLPELMRDKTETTLPSCSSPTHTDLYSGIFTVFVFLTDCRYQLHSWKERGLVRMKCLA